MCGLCGIVSKADRPVDRHRLQSMADAMVHRGPDDEGYFLDGAIGLGFRRLSIVDLEQGHQPMSNEDDTVWVVCNGEIYNHRELMQDLAVRGHRFRTHCDVEVIVHLYEEWGIDCLSKLRGMFAIALYDSTSRTLYLARDPFGIKPLFYRTSPAEMVFASDIKSVLAACEGANAAAGVQPERRIDPQSLWNYLTFQYVPEPATMWEGVHKLPAAHYLCAHAGKESVHRYWTPAFAPEANASPAYLVERIDNALQESVKLHLNADVARGAFLSSGIDSAIIATLAHRVQPIRTFSVGFEGASGAANELEMAGRFANWMGSDHHSLKVSVNDYRDALESCVFYQEDPVADPSAVGLYLLAQCASSYVKVILSGEGADELFGGYPIYHEPVSLRPFQRLPQWARTGLGTAARWLPPGLKGKSFLERGSLPLERRFVGNAKIFSEPAKTALVRRGGPSAPLVSAFAVTDPLYAATRHLDDITRMQAIDMQTWLPGDILMKADKMSMAHSIELRVPFLDLAVFEVAAAIPAKYRIAAGETKHLLRQAVARTLPADVAARPKLGFPIPLGAWLRGPLYDFAADVLSVPGADSFFDMERIRRMLTAHRAGAADHARELWVILTFLMWQNVFAQSLSSARISSARAREEVRLCGVKEIR